MKVLERAQAARVRQLERALRDERTALVAIATMALREARDPEALLRRVEGSAAAVAAQPRSSPKSREALRAAAEAFRHAVAIEMGRPQALFEPDVGHVRPEAVTKMVVDAPPPLPGMDAAGGRAQREAALDASILRVLRVPRTDPGLHQAVMRDGSVHAPDRREVYYRRVALTQAGRVAATGTTVPGETWPDRPGEPAPLWGLIEDQMEAG